MDRTELRELGEAISPHLPIGWKLLPIREEFESDKSSLRFGKLGMVFAVSRDWRNKERLNIQTREWPTYTSAETTVHDTTLGNIPAEVRVTPRDLYDPNESDISITVSGTKSPEQIAKDITRRFLPEYERIYTRCAELAEKHGDYARRTSENWQQICTLAGPGNNPDHGICYADIDGIGHLRLERSGTSAKLEVDVNPEQFERIIKALRRNG